jgi:hypothetical protein
MVPSVTPAGLIRTCVGVNSDNDSSKCIKTPVVGECSRQHPSNSMSSSVSRKLGPNGPTVSSIGLGTMGQYIQIRRFFVLCYISLAAGISVFYGTPSSTEDAHKLLSYAVERGARLWDTADCYGDCM